MNTALSPLSPARFGAIVPHPGWRQALSALLEAASGAPATIALLGKAGTGKTCLLRHLDALLRRHGRAVTFVRQGDLPWQIETGEILLIDEASRLSLRALGTLAAQRSTLAILADLPSFAGTLAQQQRSVPIIRLPPLGPDQMADFVATWLQLSERGPDAVTASGIDRLFLHSGGTPRLITRLLNAAFAFEPGAAPIDGASVDEVALLRWNGTPAPPDVPTPPSSPAMPTPPTLATEVPRRVRARRSVAAVSILSAIAATSLLVLRDAPAPAQAPSPPRPPRPIENASVPAPAPARAAPISIAEITAPALAKSPPPGAAPLAETEPPAGAADAEPALAALTSAPPRPSPVELRYSETPGLVVVARRGDTLRDLYASLYRGVAAPPFEQVAAANPRPVVPGAVVIFPAPAGGWTHQ